MEQYCGLTVRSKYKIVSALQNHGKFMMIYLMQLCKWIDLLRPNILFPLKCQRRFRQRTFTVGKKDHCTAGLQIRLLH